MSDWVAMVGDCRELPLPDESVEAVVTDPPYGLSFMGREWDHDVPGPEYWTEVKRVMKPGAHLLAFGGTRTFHWLTVAIERAGFTVRDCLSWNYGTGFPKSHNFGCECSEEELRGMRDGNRAPTEPVQEGAESDVQLRVQRRPSGRGVEEARSQRESGVDGGESKVVSGENDRREQPRMEGRSHHEEAQGELQAGDYGEVPGSPRADGEGERIHTGAPKGNGRMGGPSSNERRGSTSQEPRQPRQSAGEPGDVAEQRESQEGGGGEVCPRCGQPRGFEGFGTALKPAWEPIVLAMKPKDGTFAENALEHGVAGLNIDGTRIGVKGGTEKATFPNEDSVSAYGDGLNGACDIQDIDKGRWPANVTLSHTRFCIEPDDEEGDWDCPPSCPVRQLDEQSGKLPTSPVGVTGGREDAVAYEAAESETLAESQVGKGYNDTGGASRFYYCAKASRSEREAGLPDVEGRANQHPTVKPIDLCRWLVRLVTRKEHTVLDPFMGSGSIGCAAVQERRNYIGIDLEKEYVDIANKRIGHWQPNQRDMFKDMGGPNE